MKLLFFAQFFGHLGNSLEEIGNETIIGDLEDGGFSIRVDGHNCLGIFHTSQMLNSTGNSNSDIKLRSDDFTGLTDLQVITDESCVNRGSRSTNYLLRYDLEKCQTYQLLPLYRRDRTRA